MECTFCTDKCYFAWQVHEQLQLLRGNIRVLARVRPCSGPDAAAVECPLPGEVAVHCGADKRPQAFEFSAAFGPEASQVSLSVVERSSRPLLTGRCWHTLLMRSFLAMHVAGRCV